MPEDLIILQFLDIFSDFGNWKDWSDSWIIPAAITFVLSVALGLWLLRRRRQRANFWIIVGVILAVIFCEYGYQATPGFEAFLFTFAEFILLFALLGTVCGAVIGLILRKM